MNFSTIGVPSSTMATGIIVPSTLPMPREICGLTVVGYRTCALPQLSGEAVGGLLGAKYWDSVQRYYGSSERRLRVSRDESLELYMREIKDWSGSSVANNLRVALVGNQSPLREIDYAVVQTDSGTERVIFSRLSEDAIKLGWLPATLFVDSVSRQASLVKGVPLYLPGDVCNGTCSAGANRGGVPILRGVEDDTARAKVSGCYDDYLPIEARKPIRIGFYRFRIG